MKKILLPAALALTFGAVGLAAAPMAAHAANAKHPHRNVNHANDAGNRTGDAQVDALNAQSLQAARSGTTPAIGNGSAGTMGGGSMSNGSMGGSSMGGSMGGGSMGGTTGGAMRSGMGSSMSSSGSNSK